jgi:predicted MPP superfamily phosphohydrolase
MKNTFYKIESATFSRNLRSALASDLHAQDYKSPLALLKEAKPDYILLGGDIFEALDGSYSEKNETVFPFLEEVARIAPSFYCTGNHEDGAAHSEFKGIKSFRGRGHRYSEDAINAIKSSGVRFLLDSYEIYDGIAFGGLASGLILEGHMPDLEFLEAFSRLSEPKVLLCHHPEYYEPYVKNLPIELTLSGHAHGGQWRFFGRGVYAPGQGLFPKYTSGIHDGRFIISRGLKRTLIPPRIFNPTEIVIIDT